MTMTEEDKELIQLLRGFSPEQSSEVDFMARLQCQMETIDLVKKHIEKERRRNKYAVISAALTGCIVGILMTLALPFLFTAIEQLALWVVVSISALCSTLAVYYLARTLFKSEQSNYLPLSTRVSLP